MSGVPDSVRRELQTGMRLARQGSYLRRLPDKEAVPVLMRARSKLRAFTSSHPDEADGFRLLSLADEAFLNYELAIANLEKACAIEGKRSKKDLKRLAALREAKQEWLQLPMSPLQLSRLKQFLEESLGKSRCDHSLRFTERWVSEEGLPVQDTLLALQQRGGYCDCEVLFNAT